MKLQHTRIYKVLVSEHDRNVLKLDTVIIRNKEEPVIKHHQKNKMSRSLVLQCFKQNALSLTTKGET
jgi:hypothetical protein